MWLPTATLAATHRLRNFKPDLCILSEHWGRKGELEDALSIPQYKVLEYSRCRQNYKCKKDKPSIVNATGGGAAIIYNEERFEVEELVTTKPESVESVYAIVTPKHKANNNIEKILIGAVYIAPRSQFKQEAVESIIETMHYAQSICEKQLKYFIAGDVNRTDISDILDSNGRLQQICSVPTRNTSVLENIVTDLATFYHEATTLPPLENDKEGKGGPSDHNLLVVAPKVGTQFQQVRKKRSIKTMPMPESSITEFMRDLSDHSWSEVFETQSANDKACNFHSTITCKLKRHFKEKHVKMSSLDKEWFTPALKSQKAEMLNELFRHGETTRWSTLRKTYRKGRRAAVRNHFKQFTDGMRFSEPGKFFKIAKRLGTANKDEGGNINIECIEHLTPKEQVEEVAKSFAEVSQQYSPLDLQQIHSFLPAELPPQLQVHQVWQRIKSLKKTKSTLAGDLPEKLRKEASIFLAEPLTDIYNACLVQGVYPDAWKMETVTPVPKKTTKLKLLTDIRKIACTSDYSKLFEKFLKDWILEDISKNLSPTQYGGQKGMGTEHVIVNFVDRVLKLLDNSTTRPAVMTTFVDWRGAFDRQDPTITVNKFIQLGVRSSLIPLLIDYLNNRQMKVKLNGEESEVKSLIGGSPQGTLIGQLLYIGGSDDAASEICDEDKFKYIDDLEVIELVSLAGVLTEYDFTSHVASDVGICQSFLPPEAYSMQGTLNNLSNWTAANKMQINEEKSNYMIFTRSKEDFTTRLTINEKKLDQVKVAKLLGVWISEDLSWAKNCQEICKKAFTRINMLSRLKYAGMNRSDLINIYIMHIRSVTEYCSTAFHSSLLVEQENKLETIQKVSLKIILGQNYTSYEDALALTSMKTLKNRRHERSLKYAIKALKHPLGKKMFPLNNNDGSQNTRNSEQYHVNFAYTESYKKSAIPTLQRLLNQHQEK